MPNDGHKSAYTTVSIDRETGALVNKICKRYSLKKGEVVRLAFAYIDKAHINPTEAPESVKSELAKINKRQDDVIRFIRSYEEKELRAMGTTEREQADAMKRYICEVFIPEYARNFNKGLSAADIRFYGKVHFSRDRSENELNVHCHLIVSRKDRSNKKKLSPLTNHRNTGKGIIRGGFDRKTLFQSVERGFDRLFGYNRQLSETFEYCNTMKNGTISEQLNMQEQQIKETSQIQSIPQNTLTGEKEKKRAVSPPKKEEKQERNKGIKR